MQKINLNKINTSKNNTNNNLSLPSANAIFRERDIKVSNEKKKILDVFYESIGVVLNKGREYAKGLESHNGALAIRTELYGEEHLDIAISSNNVGKALEIQGKKEEALEYYLKALSIYEKGYGKRRSIIAQLYNSIGSILIKHPDKYMQGIEYLCKALALGNKRENSLEMNNNV